MTPKQLGHRDAAWGTPRVTDGHFIRRADAQTVDYDTAYDAVLGHTAKGLDPNGHRPRIPHLCERDVSKVCNCCHSCGTACWAEKLQGVTVRGLLRKVLGR